MNISKILIFSACIALAPIRADAQVSANANVRAEQLTSEQQVVLERALILSCVRSRNFAAQKTLS